MKAAGIPHENRRPPSGGRRRRPPGLVAKSRNRAFSIDGCVNDAIGRRTSMSRSGSAYATSDTISYTYNDRSELTGAVSNVDTTYSYSYAYDPIGNRVTASEAGVPWTYTTNNLNQYTSATENNTQLSFAYDLDGSMTYRPVDATSGWTQVWNGENRMVETNKGTDRLTFKYDYMGRRVEKCVYSGNILVSKTLFIYDGFKCVEELDGLDNNAVVMRHAWQPFEVGLDVILSTTDGNGTCCFLHDGNKNVMQRTVANGALLGKYAYAPFGENMGTNSAHVGFSSEVAEDDTGMVYYNYRYLEPRFGRWIRIDPLWEYYTINQYSFVHNNSQSIYDILGMYHIDIKLMEKDIWFDDIYLQYPINFDLKCNKEGLTNFIYINNIKYEGRNTKYSVIFGIIGGITGGITGGIITGHAVPVAGILPGVVKGITTGVTIGSIIGQGMELIVNEKMVSISINISISYICTCENGKYIPKDVDVNEFDIRLKGEDIDDELYIKAELYDDDNKIIK